MSVLNRKILAVSALLIAISGGLYGCLSDKAAIPTTMAVSAASIIPLPGKGYTIYTAGDIADCRKFKAADSGAATTAALITKELAGNKNASVLTLGDNTYPVGLLSEFSDCYDPTWGAFKEHTYPSPGNHDYGTPNAVGYYEYFGTAAGPAQRGYYSMTLGKWHVVSLNSNLKNEAYAAQLAWLKDDLEKHPTHCTLAYWHHPVFSSGGHGNNGKMREVWQILQAAHADVVLASHDHNYERFAPQDAVGQRDDAHGIREFVVGTGGAFLSSQILRKDHSEVFGNASHGVLKMVLKDTGYEWEFLPVAGGTFTDSGSALCH